MTEYWEAWSSRAVITLHWGKLGEEGETREFAADPGTSPDDVIKSEAKSIRAAGFKPLKGNELHSVIIQYKVKDNGAKHDFDKRVEVEKLMNERLGWTGLGHCDGGDMGSGEMNVFCVVADVAIAKGVIVHELKSKDLLHGAVIAQRVRDAYKVLWPQDFSGKFSVA